MRHKKKKKSLGLAARHRQTSTSAAEPSEGGGRECSLNESSVVFQHGEMAEPE